MNLVCETDVVFKTKLVQNLYFVFCNPKIIFLNKCLNGYEMIHIITDMILYHLLISKVYKCILNITKLMQYKSITI